MSKRKRWALVVALPLLFACDPVTYGKIIIDAEHPLDEQCLIKAAEQLRAKGGGEVVKLGSGVGVLGMSVTRAGHTVGIGLNSSIEPTTAELSFMWLGRSPPEEERGSFQLLDDLHTIVLGACTAKESTPTIRRTCSGRTCKDWLAGLTTADLRAADERAEEQIEVRLSFYIDMSGEDEPYVMKLGKEPKTFTFKIEEDERLSLKMTPLDGCRVSIEILRRDNVTTTRPLSWPQFFEPGATFAIGVQAPRHRQEIRGSVSGVGACSRSAPA